MGVITAKQAPGKVQRGDIEGLRAVAVILVVFGHLIGVPTGGFVGVDVFFVISGFLITGLLVKEQMRNGRISYRDFYARRARRILPAAAVVLAVTCIAAQLVFFGSRAKQVFADAGWSLFSAANWHFAAIGTDYFQQGRPQSPLQHFWSLAVEEQYYLVWPLLIMILFAVFGRRRRAGAGLAALVGCVLVIVVASFAWAAHQSVTNPAVAYFSTFTRAWELGVGALLAFLAPRLSRMPVRMRMPLAWLGLAGIATSCILITPTSTFPAPWGALPVLATALVIAAGTGGAARGQWLITNPASRYVGRVSYSIYLWHWPVVIILPTLMAKDSPQFIAVALTLIAVSSVLCYHLVETPVRRSSWLSPKAPRSAISPRFSRSTKVAGLVGLVTVSIVTAGMALQSTTAQLSTAEVSAVSAVPMGSTTPKPGESGSNATDSQISAALNSKAWPDLNPSLDELDHAKAAEWKGCGNVDESQLKQCSFASGKTDKLVVVVGDSIGISYLPGLRAAFEPRGWRVQGLTYGQCPAPVIDTSAGNQGSGFSAQCAQHQQWALDQVKGMRPDLVIMSSAENTLRRLPGSSSPEQAREAWQTATAATAKKLAESAKRVVILAPPPEGSNLVQCATRVNKPADCVSKVDSQWLDMSEADRAAAKSAHVQYVDTRGWFCDAENNCPAFIGVTPVRADGVHLTGAFSQQLAPELADVLLKPTSA